MKSVYPNRVPVNPAIFTDYLQMVTTLVNILGAFGVMAIYPNIGEHKFTQFVINKPLFDALCTERDGSYGHCVKLERTLYGMELTYELSGMSYSCHIPNEEYFDNYEKENKE